MTIRTGTRNSKIQDGEDVDVLRNLKLDNEVSDPRSAKIVP